MGNATADTSDTSHRLKPERNEGPGEVVEERSDALKRLNPALLYAGDVTRSFSKSTRLGWCSICIALRSKALLALEGHDDAARAGCIFSMFRRRRDMLRFKRSRSWMPVVKFLADSSARSIEELPSTANNASFTDVDIKHSYQVKIVSSRFSDAFDPCSRASSFESVFSFSDHFALSIARIGLSDRKVSRICSSSEKIETLSVRTMITCSIMIMERRERAASCLPTRYASNWLRQA